MDNFYCLLEHHGEDGWCEQSFPEPSRRKIGRLLYRGQSRGARRLRRTHGFLCVPDPLPTKRWLRVCTMTARAAELEMRQQRRDWRQEEKQLAELEAKRN